MEKNLLKWMLTGRLFTASLRFSVCNGDTCASPIIIDALDADVEHSLAAAMIYEWKLTVRYSEKASTRQG